MHSALSWLRKNPHAWLMGYWGFYLFSFFSLEQLDPEYTIIHCFIDDWIPSTSGS